MHTPPAGEDWIAATSEQLATETATAWAISPQCGAVVTFAGTVRDHSEGRDGVSMLEYEAYLEQVGPRLQAVASAARRRWPMIGRVVIWHRIGRLYLGEVSVVTVASTPHRPEAFEAARFLIDAVKTTVPIWKKETWSQGSDWSLCDHELDDLEWTKEQRDALVDEIDELSGSTSYRQVLDGGPQR